MTTGPVDATPGVTVAANASGVALHFLLRLAATVGALEIPRLRRRAVEAPAPGTPVRRRTARP